MYLILDSVLFFSQWIHVAAKTVHYERERERERERRLLILKLWLNEGCEVISYAWLKDLMVAEI